MHETVTNSIKRNSYVLRQRGKRTLEMSVDELETYGVTILRVRRPKSVWLRDIDPIQHPIVPSSTWGPSGDTKKLDRYVTRWHGKIMTIEIRESELLGLGLAIRTTGPVTRPLTITLEEV